MTEFQGLLAAECFLVATVLIGGACEFFNRRGVAATAMLCAVLGFTGVVFTRYLPHDRYIASEAPKETLYHVAEVKGGELVSPCIHAPQHDFAVFGSERQARKTGRVPCRCVRHDSPVAIVSRQTPARGQR